MFVILAASQLFAIAYSFFEVQIELISFLRQRF